jgi:hypothetical protein
MTRTLIFAALAVLAASLSACYTYQAVQQTALQDCDRFQNMIDRQRCREANSMTKQRYDEERAKLQKKAE